jgi:hypothetical protein
MNHGTHLVLNRGRGQPQVVTPRNFLKNEDVQESKLLGVVSFKKGDKSIADRVDHTLRKTFNKGKAIEGIRRKLDKAAEKKWVKESGDWDAVKAERHQEWKAGHEAGKKHLDYQQSVLKSQDDLSFAKQKKRLAQKTALKTEARVEGPYGGHPYDWDPELRKQIFAAAAKKIKQNGPKDNGRVYKPNKLGPPPRRGTTSEDARELEGKAARVAKTKKHLKKRLMGEAKKAVSWNPPEVQAKYAKEKKEAKMFASAKREIARQKKKELRKEDVVSEMDNAKLVDYLQKAIANRKLNTVRARNSYLVHDPDRLGGPDGERAEYHYNKSMAKVNKRSKGIKMAVSRLASHLPGEKVSESAAPGKEDWIKANKARFITQYGEEKGLRILYAKAWKDSKTNESAEDKYKKAAEKVVKLAKKNLKGKNHVDTEPKLNLPDKGTGGPLEGSETGERNDKLS